MHFYALTNNYEFSAMTDLDTTNFGKLNESGPVACDLKIIHRNDSLNHQSVQETVIN